MIYERNFITNVRDARQGPSLKTHQPSRRHALGSAAPPEAIKNDSGTVQTVKATAIWWAIRLKFFPFVVRSLSRSFNLDPDRFAFAHSRRPASRAFSPTIFQSRLIPRNHKTNQIRTHLKLLTHVPVGR